MSRNTNGVGQQRRLEYIRDQLSRAGEVEIHGLAQRLSVSEMTIRRDLAILESEGQVLRTHGGAASAKRFTFEFTFRSQQKEHQDKKRAIAARAASEIRDGQVIILDTGTTTLEIARAIRDRRNLKVITTSLAIVSELQFAHGIQTILLGGYLREGSPDLCGPLAEQNLSTLQADVAFIGADAIDAKGNVYTDDLSLVNLDRKMASVSARVIVVANSSKFHRRAMCKILGPGDYDTLMTDDALDPRRARKLEKQGVTLEIVPASATSTSGRR